MSKLAIVVVIIFVVSSLVFNGDYSMGKKLYLLPIGELDKHVIHMLQNDLGKAFGLECLVLESIPLPKEAFDKKRRQYYSPLILQTILEDAPVDYHCILGICDVDLFVPDLNFIFGQADPNRGLALISLIRLRQEYYRLPANEEIFFERTIKEAVHELGHTFGLLHCTDYRCVMYFSNSLLDTDRKGVDFCPNCKKKLTGMLEE